ncbi:MAG: hypothetical protein IK106_00985 [Clostridiales bacterium]|nr:hypothetical protein [Clostridiales bacterium]
MKKKVMALLMALALSVSVCACSKEKSEKETKSKQTTEETSEETEDTSEESSDETSDTTTDLSTDATSDVTGGTTSVDDFDGQTGVNAVIKDLEDHGFKVEKNPAKSYAPSFEGYLEGFDAESADGTEHYCYREYGDAAKIDELDAQGLPFDANGRVRINFGEVIWHYATDKQSGEFQYIAMNPRTLQVLYYRGPKDKGSRSNCYAFEMEIIPENAVTVPFEDDPEYPDGKGLTRVPQDVPAIDLKNAKAAAMLEDIYRDGNVVITLPSVGQNMAGIQAKSKGFMVFGGDGGKYENELIIYAETNMPDNDATFREIQQELIDDGETFTFELKGDCQVAINEMNGAATAVIFDMETGYYLRLIVESKDRVLDLAEDFGIDIG